ncbi:MAG: MCE family protein [Alphaproteobacteria bacterium]|nr:MCE family protein [Alphaproteobacteria bacterium]MBN2779703.1 MCE family protein [Alphaproteobacteria bacterium]
MDKERKKHIIVGALAFLFLWTFFALIRQPSTVGGYQLSMVFDRADGLRNGDDVRLNGMKIGEVVAKEINADYQAVVTVEIESIQLPDDSIAFIQTDGLFGGKYIQIGVGGSEDHFEDGDEVEYTQGSADIEGLAREVIRRIKKK